MTAPILVVANVRAPGTKHFRAGGKVCVLPPTWDPGEERVRVVAPHRGGGPRLIALVMSTRRLENWRVAECHKPRLRALLERYGHLGAWTRQTAERFVASMTLPTFTMMPLYSAGHEAPLDVDRKKILLG